MTNMQGNSGDKKKGQTSGSERSDWSGSSTGSSPGGNVGGGGKTMGSPGPSQGPQSGNVAGRSSETTNMQSGGRNVQGSGSQQNVGKQQGSLADDEE